MRYIPQKSPLIDKYYIWDTVEKKITTETGFDIIVDIVADKIAVVGRATSYQSGHYYYSTYKYQLVDVKGRPISEKEFDFVYPYDSFIYCKNKGLPINKLSYLDNYIWDNESGRYLSKYPFYSYDSKNAILKGDYWRESYKSGYMYQYIDTKGNVLKEAKVESKETVERVFFGFRKQDFSNLVYIDVLADYVDKRWGRINELAKRTDEKYFNICDFNLSEKYIFHNVKISFAWGEFLILIKMEEVQAEIKKHVSHIFFHKRKEWEHEQEYRLLKRCPLVTREEYLLLGHALKFVILSSKLQNIDEVLYYKKIKDIKEKVDIVEKARNIGKKGRIPILVYGNGLFDYALCTEGGEEGLWNSKEGYNVICTIKMETKYTKEELMRFSNEELLKITKDRAIDFHLNNSRLAQLCVNDLQGFDCENSLFYTRTGIKILLQDVDYIEVS